MIFDRNMRPAPQLVIEIRLDNRLKELLTKNGIDFTKIFAGWPESGRILGIFAMSDNYRDLTDDLRYLILTEDVRREMKARGYRFVIFCVGDRMFLINLDALDEEGTYIFAIDPDGDELISVDPKNKDAVLAAAWHAGEDELTRDESGRITSWDPDTQILSWNADGKKSVAKELTEEIPDEAISFMESEDWPEPYIGK
ncbi:MAG: hypothetical protein IIY86_01265 [Lachnospiraceae bacterium]|nr:hypothetical protein [Lachnospiraceae bacterium]